MQAIIDSKKKGYYCKNLYYPQRLMIIFKNYKNNDTLKVIHENDNSLFFEDKSKILLSDIIIVAASFCNFMLKKK